MSVTMLTFARIKKNQDFYAAVSSGMPEMFLWVQILFK